MSESECVDVTSVSSWTKMCKRIQYNHTQPLQIELGKQTVSLGATSGIPPTLFSIHTKVLPVNFTNILSQLHRAVQSGTYIAKCDTTCQVLATSLYPLHKLGNQSNCTDYRMTLW